MTAGFSRQHTMALSRIGRDSENIAIFTGRYSSFRDRLVVIGEALQSDIRHTTSVQPDHF